jgi:hypothetical protein
MSKFEKLQKKLAEVYVLYRGFMVGGKPQTWTLSLPK